ncbi:hypothetical protein CLV24_101269 [Pontibacter ummariensis]|uniref:Lipocalin-like domain-containing protein n=1 Tax=Pontibacter ummariensis TaxID=1610492 RepID=A0A239BD12_9BACT|nr:hypothetical protein [Pontibacter ummariensis]PRY16423.1 hypothetical protein CLV24_101269 [Pontibacter ummariensis]SNS04903.1 hypothetical protein SAMN06296052_101269 [Pontibacter ummariensis]
MRNFYLALLAVILLLGTGCERDKLDVLPADALYGTWELRASSNGWGSSQVYQAGNGNKLTFSQNRYVRNFEGKKQAGKYRLKAAVSDLTKRPTTYIVFYEGNEPAHTLPQSVSTANDTLILGMDVYDGGFSITRR